MVTRVKVDGAGERFAKFSVWSAKIATYFEVEIRKGDKPGPHYDLKRVREIFYEGQRSKATILSDLKPGKGAEHI